MNFTLLGDSVSMPMLAVAGLIAVVVAVAGYMLWTSWSTKKVDGFEASINQAPTEEEDEGSEEKPVNLEKHDADDMTHEHPPA